MSRLLLGIGALTLAAVAVSAQVGKKDQAPPWGALAKAAQDESAKAKGETSGKTDTSAKTDASPKTEAKTDTGKTDAKTDSAKKPAASGSVEKPLPKRYTNQDLGPDAERTDSFSPYPTARRPLPGRSDLGQDEAYWRSRARPYIQRITAYQDRIAGVKARIASLKPDPAGVTLDPSRGTPSTERQYLTQQLRSLEYELANYERALKDLENEGRRVGALPGWFR